MLRLKRSLLSELSEELDLDWENILISLESTVLVLAAQCFLFMFLAIGAYKASIIVTLLTASVLAVSKFGFVNAVKDPSTLIYIALVVAAVSLVSWLIYWLVATLGRQNPGEMLVVLQIFFGAYFLDVAFLNFKNKNTAEKTALPILIQLATVMYLGSYLINLK